MILTRTPYRVSMFGGGTDYPDWYLAGHRGAVLGMAIDKYCYVGVKPMPPGQVMTSPSTGRIVPIRFRVQYAKVDDCTSILEVHHPAVRAILAYHKVEASLEFHCFGDLPGRSGLGGSSAFTVGCLHALQKLLKLPNTGQPLDLAREAVSVEQFAIKETVGLQDQIFAAAGGIRLIAFGRAGTEVKELKISNARRQELEQSLLLVYSGTMRDAHVMAAKQIAEFPHHHHELEMMTEQAENAAGCLESESMPVSTLGHWLARAWRLKRALHPEISSPAIDTLYTRGLSLGALGGKLLGAGGGGFFLFYVPPELQEKFKARIDAPCVSFRIGAPGSRVIIDEEPEDWNSLLRRGL